MTAKFVICVSFDKELHELMRSNGVDNISAFIRQSVSNEIKYRGIAVQSKTHSSTSLSVMEGNNG
jgi:hypothetical protein